MKGDKLVIDISYYNDLSSEQWDLLATVLDGVIVRLSFGLNEDTSAQKHVDQCKRLGLPYSGYHWVDPTKNMTKQLENVVRVVDKFKPTSMFNDYEQYWTDWDAYMRQDLVEAKRTKFTPTQLNNYYSTFNNKIRQTIKSVPIGNYTGLWFMDDFCPDMKTWIDENYLEARYLRYYEPDYWKIKKSGFPIYISYMREIADEVQIANGIARQFETYVEIDGFSKWHGYHMDWDIFSPDGYSLMFGGEMGKVLNMTFVSQLGEGAGDHHNDCGLACCSMVLLASKDIFVQVDEWYKMDGWGAPSADIGTTAYQLQRALGLFNVETVIGNALTIGNVQGFINKALPFIPLMDYKVLSDAGVTHFKGNFLHWIVIIGYDENNIVAFDPYRPFEKGGKITIPNQVFLNAYRNSYTACINSIEGGTMPVEYNGTVITRSLNVRATPPSPSGVLGNKVGSLVLGNRVYIERSTITTTNWGNVLNSDNPSNPVGWVSLDYIKLEPVVEPPASDEKAIRLDELQKARVGFNQYYNERKAELS